MGSMIITFWTSGDILPGFPNFYASLPACNGFLRFTSGATPADFLVASMKVELFHSMYWHKSIGRVSVHDRTCRYLTA